MKILIIEDSPKKVEVLRRVIEEVQIEVVSTLNGAEEIISKKWNDFEGIILDMEFPYLSVDEEPQHDSGNKFLKFLKDRNFNIPVIGYSCSNRKWYGEYEWFYGQICIIGYESELKTFIKKLKSRKL